MTTTPIHNLTDVWNDVATTFNAIKMNVTDTASADASKLFLLQVGGTDVVAIDKSGAFQDSLFALADNADRTKKVQFQVSGVTTGTTRVLTVPDFDGTIATLAGTETFTNKTIDSANNTLTLDLSEGTLTGTTAEFNTALSDDSFATLTNSVTLTNKTLTSPTINGGSISGITDLAVADGGTGASNAGDARTNLGLVIGTDVQAYDAGLLSIAGLTTAADKMIYTTASDTYAVADLSAFARTVLDDTDSKTAFETLAASRRVTPLSTAIEWGNLNNGAGTAGLVYETSGGSAGLDTSVITGIANDANAIGMTRLICSYMEYQGFWYYKPTINYTAPSGTLTLSASSGTGVTATSSASDFASTDVGSLIVADDGTGLYRAVITAYSSATQVTVAILNSAASVSQDLTALSNRKVPAVTSIPADSVSTSPWPADSTTTGLTSAEWEIRYYPWDRETQRYGFYWKDNPSVYSTIFSEDLMTTLLTQAASNGQKVVFGLGRAGDTDLFNDIINEWSQPSSATLGSLPGVLISSPSATISGSTNALTSARGTRTNISDGGAGGFLGPGVTGVNTEGKEIWEIGGPGRAYVYEFTNASNVQAMIIEPFSSNSIAAANWDIREVTQASPWSADYSFGIRFYEAMTRAQEIAKDLHSQYGSHAAFGGWYISHEPATIRGPFKWYLDGVMNTDIAGDGSLDSLTDAGEVVWIGPGNTLDIPCYYHRIDITNISKASTAVATMGSDQKPRRGDAVFLANFAISNYTTAVGGTALDWARLCNKTFYVGDVSTDKFELYEDSALATPVDTSGYGGTDMATSAGIYAIEYGLFDPAYLAGIIDATGIKHIAPQGSSGYGLSNRRAGTESYLDSEYETAKQLDEYFAGWRVVIDEATNVNLIANIESWAIENNGELARPAMFDRMRREAKIVEPYCDELEIYALFSYMESGNATYTIRNLGNGHLDYGLRARRLYDEYLANGFWGI